MNVSTLRATNGSAASIGNTESLSTKFLELHPLAINPLTATLCTYLLVTHKHVGAQSIQGVAHACLSHTFLRSNASVHSAHIIPPSNIALQHYRQPARAQERPPQERPSHKYVLTRLQRLSLKPHHSTSPLLPIPPNPDCATPAAPRPQSHTTALDDHARVERVPRSEAADTAVGAGAAVELDARGVRGAADGGRRRRQTLPAGHGQERRVWRS